MKRYFDQSFCIIGSKGKFHASYQYYLPPLEYINGALDTPKQEVVRYYKNINDKTELYLREKLSQLQKELQEHFSQVHSNKKGINKYNKYI